MKPASRYINILVLIVIFIAFGLGEAAWAKPRRAARQDRFADIVIEAETGYILRSRNRNAHRHPASLTKMMTLYLVFQALENGRISPDTQLRVSANAACQPPTKIGLKAGQTIGLRDAMLSLVTESANDAAVVLAENLGGSVQGFVVLMNKQARALGMKQTTFRNPSGLPDSRQVTTARDMAVLAQALISHYPGFYPYFSLRRHVYEGREMRNHNRLMQRYEGMDGIKTGYTNASGFNLAASAQRNGVRLIGVVFGGQTAASRDRHMKDILDQSFKRARQPQIKRKLTAEGARADETERIAVANKEPAAFAPRASQSSRRDTYAQEASGTAGAWGLQVGAFSEILGAQRALEDIAHMAGPLLNEAGQSLQKITMTDGSVVYRARFTGVDQKTARAVCTHLIKRGQSCLVVSGT